MTVSDVSRSAAPPPGGLAAAYGWHAVMALATFANFDPPAPDHSGSFSVGLGIGSRIQWAQWLQALAPLGIAALLLRKPTSGDHTTTAAA